MMRILWHSNAPWMPTGYGQQTGVFASRIAALGHEVAISSFIGLQGRPIEWDGLKVWPSGQDIYNNDIFADRAKLHFGDEAGIVLTLTDVWVLSPKEVAKVPTACWMPVDCRPLSSMDDAWLEKSRALPIAMSRFGQRELEVQGYRALYVPHGVNTEIFTPIEGRGALRDAMGIPRDAFVVGINAANRGKDPSRKAFPQQLMAFSRLHRRHSDAVLLLHSQVDSPHGMELAPLIEDLGISDAVRLSDQHAYTSGMLPPSYVAGMYNCCDVVANATYGEGFGLPVLEAQACGTPVIITDCSAMPELLGSGWKVAGHPYWVPSHNSWWKSPDVDSLYRAMEKAYNQAERFRGRAREFALAYDADRVLTEYWKPALEELENFAAEWRAD